MKHVNRLSFIGAHIENHRMIIAEKSLHVFDGMLPHLIRTKPDDVITQLVEEIFIEDDSDFLLHHGFSDY
jgi:hypothetical protein